MGINLGFGLRYQIQALDLKHMPKFWNPIVLFYLFLFYFIILKFDSNIKYIYTHKYIFLKYL